MLAIIIPYYKLTFFEATLQSLAAQTCQDFKVYIGDDASPENPAMLLEKYKGKFDFVYHRFATNLGGTSLTKQWERCIALSGNEEWLMILGDDDVLGENVVEEFYKNLSEIDKIGCNVVRFASQSIDKIKNVLSKVYKNAKLEKAADFFYSRYSGLVRCSLSEHVFRKESYVNFSFRDYPLAWHSDDYAWLDFAEDKPIFAINDAIVLITVSNESLTGKLTNLSDKNKAESMFFMDIINHKLNLFPKEVRLEYLLNAEVTIKKSRQLTIEEWRNLSLKYLINFRLVPFVKFVRRFIISLI